MQKSFFLYAALSCLLAFLTPSFANAAGALFPAAQTPAPCAGECQDLNGNSEKTNLLKEIHALVEEYILNLPADIDLCVLELYEEREKNRDAEKHCGDKYARTYTADEWREEYREADRASFAHVLRGKKGMLTIPTFLYDSNTMEIERSALHLLEQKAESLYFDIRGNGGGFTESALRLLYHFAREKDRFLTLRFRTKNEDIYDTAAIQKEYGLKYPPGILRDIPVCVIIDENSASASEIFAGVMKDWGYCVAGGASYGKGVGQIIFLLNDGSYLKITAYEFFVGNSQTKINSIGVIPNAPLPEELRK